MGNVTNHCIAQESGKDWTLYNGDACELIKALPSESVHHSIFSPPFAALYVYSDSDRDMGNCLDEVQFFEHFDFLVEELFRVIKPGRVVSVHCMEMPRLKGKDGWIGVYEFPDDIRSCFKKAGFLYDGQCTIWKNPVTAMQRTKSIRLLHKQVKKDSSVSGWALPDYLLKFKKPGENQEPVIGEFDAWKGDDSFASHGRLSIDIWQRYASPVWTDIDQSRTLQYRSARAESDERHICPLQLDVIDRSLQLWTNPGDVVLDPFNGVGSTVSQSVEMGRRGIGFELKTSYFTESVRNVKQAEQVAAQEMLFT